MAEPKGSDPFNDVVKGKTYDVINARLIDMGMSPDKANRYGIFCQALYNEVQGNHDISDALKNLANAEKLQPMARQLGLTSSVRTLGDVSLAGKAGLVNVFVDYIKGLALACGVEINDCSFSIAKVALDIASAGVGAVSSVTGVGVVWLALSVVATFQDSYELANVCFLSK